MSTVLSYWNSSCATLNLWGDLDTRSSNSGFPGETASKLTLKKLVLARLISWTALTRYFPFLRAIPAFYLFYWYVTFTKTGCYPGPNLGGFLIDKAFSAVMRPRILLEGPMCVHRGSVCTQTSTSQGSLIQKMGLCMSISIFSVIHPLW